MNWPIEKGSVILRSNRLYAFAAALLIMLSLSACANNAGQDGVPAAVPQTEDSVEESPIAMGQIYLYGELHGVQKILDQEFALWDTYYNDNNMRHLFIEMPYYTAEFLNLWMRSDSDEILDAVYDDLEGTASHTPDVKAFYQQIKSECPETVFHGTDVGHQYDTIGERYLQHLKDQGQQDSEEYKRAQEVMEQGKYFYDNDDHVYRENKMAENFAYEYDKLGGESVMGIYGGAHTGLEDLDYSTQTIPCMANQLKQKYGSIVSSEDLTALAKDIEPERTDVIELDGKEYQASYFGKEDLTGFKDFVSREFWRLENAYDDFKDQPKTGDVLPYDNYPMLIEAGQVFAVKYVMADGSEITGYYRSDGEMWNGVPATEQFAVE